MKISVFFAVLLPLLLFSGCKNPEPVQDNDSEYLMFGTFAGE